MTLFPPGFVFPVKSDPGQPPPPSLIGLEVGSRVRAMGGMFAGLEGEVKEICESTGTFLVELTIFGRPVPVELEYDDVEEV
jgi:transcriptional antiterminator NusG